MYVLKSQQFPGDLGVGVKWDSDRTCSKYASSCSECSGNKSNAFWKHSVACQTTPQVQDEERHTMLASLPRENNTLYHTCTYTSTNLWELFQCLQGVALVNVGFECRWFKLWSEKEHVIYYIIECTFSNNVSKGEVSKFSVMGPPINDPFRKGQYSLPLVARLSTD